MFTTLSIYAKIFQHRQSTEKNANGLPVVDQFIALQDITLQANESKNISFDWEIPSWTTRGTYQLATFVISSEKYNLLGLSFTDDIVGNVHDFEIVSDRINGVQFDKETVTINSIPYLFAGYPTRIQKSEDALINAEIVNTTDITQRIPVSYSLYQWDAISKENKLEEKTITVTVPANSTAPVSFVVQDTVYPVYLVELRAKYQDTSSILNIRFVRDSIDKLRINFPAITTYPLEKDTQVELFSCMHNISANAVDASLQLSVLDENGNVVYSDEYVGTIGGNMMGFATTFSPKTTLENFSIKAELFQEGTLIEEDTISYTCNDFGTCPDTSMDTSLLAKLWFIFIMTGIAVVIIIVGLLIKTILSAKAQRKNKKYEQTF